MTAAIDTFLAASLRGPAPWPPETDPEAVLARVRYHGIGGRLAGRGLPGDWPEGLRAAILAEGRARAMWELRHRQVLGELLARLAAAGVEARLLKGTALAYGFYPVPAERPRGDSDLLVRTRDRARAADVLRAAGFVPFYAAGLPDESAQQAPFTFVHPDGSSHEIDLHWSALHSHALAAVLPEARLFATGRALPALGPHAFAPAISDLLLHAVLHRAVHVLSPYFVGGEEHFGGDRLIWLCDIDLLVRAMSPAETAEFAARAVAGGVGPLCAAALEEAQAALGSPLDDRALARMRAAPEGPAMRFLTHEGASARLFDELRAVQGWRARARYLRLRLMPPAEFVRAKYPGEANRPIALLYLRRFIGAFRPRRGASR